MRVVYCTKCKDFIRSDGSGKCTRCGNDVSGFVDVYNDDDKTYRSDPQSRNKVMR